MRIPFFIYFLFISMSMLGQPMSLHQSLSKEMNLLFDYCVAVKNAVYCYDADALAATVQQWKESPTGNKLTFQNKSIYLSRFISLQISDSTGLCSMNRHLDFWPSSVKACANAMLLGNYGDDIFDGIYTETALLMRGNYDCQMICYALKSNGTIKLRETDDIVGIRELLIVAEKKTHLAIQIRDSLGNELQEESPEGVVKIRWKMQKVGYYDLVVTNYSDKESSIVIVSN